MDKVNLSDQIALFDEQSGKVKGLLTDLLDAVKAGRAPSDVEMAGLETNVSDLQKRYELIYAIAQSSLPAEELPAHGSSVDKLADAVENSRSKYIVQQLIRARTVLSKFMRVRSLIVEYAAALAPYQSAAADLLSQMTEDTVEELLPQTHAPEMFLEAMFAETLHSATGLQLMKQIQQHYPEMEIFLGLSGKKYFCDDTETADRDDSVSVENTASQATHFSAYSEQTDERTDTQTVEGPTSEGPMIEETRGYEVINKVKTGARKATSFRNEIERIARHTREVRTILPLFTNLGVLSKEQVFAFGVCTDCFSGDDNSQKRVYAAIDTLAEKGYLARIAADPENELYCLSGYCCGCMQKESVKYLQGLWNLSVGSVKIFADTEIDRNQAVLSFTSNSMLLNCLFAQKQYLDEEEYERVKKSIKWHDNHYNVAVYDEGVPYTAYLWQPSADATDLDAKYIIVLKDLVDLIHEYNPACERVFVVADDHVYSCDPAVDIISQLDGVNDSEHLTVPENAADAEPQVAEDSERVAISEAPTSDDTTPDLQPETPSEAESNKDNDEILAGHIAEEVEQILDNDPNDQTLVSQCALTPQVLLEKGCTPKDEEFCCVIHELLSNTVPENKLTSTVVNAVLLARGAGAVPGYSCSERLSAQLRLATTLLLDEYNYSSECLSKVFDNDEAYSPALTLAAYMHAMLTPTVSYDYGLKAQTEQYKTNFNDYFNGLAVFKKLFNELSEVRKVKGGGFTPAVIALLGDVAESERFITALQRDARSNMTIVTPKTRMKALPVLYNNEFGSGSDLYLCMEIIAKTDRNIESLEQVEMVLEDFCDVTVDVTGKEYRLNEDKINDKLNQAWDTANARSKFKLEYAARDQAFRQYKQRLEVMLVWAEHIRSSTDKRENIGRLKLLRSNILKLIEEIRTDPSWRQVKDANVLAWTLIHMKDYLTDSESNIQIYADLLYTGIFSLSQEGIPEIGVSLGNIKYYELWRNALKHIVAPRKTIEELTAEILDGTPDGKEGLKDNLCQLSMLGRLTGSDDEVFSVSQSQGKEAEDSANIRTERFKNDLELAYTYYRINETEKETLAGIMNQYKSAFYKIGDFACWRRFLEALEEQIHEYADGRKKELSSRLNAKLAIDENCSLLREAQQLLETDLNFAVTEEYLNRYEAGERELDSTVLFDRDYFSDFLDPAVFDPLQLECIRNKGSKLNSFGWNYLEKKLPSEWTTRQRDDSKALVSSWPLGKNSATQIQVEKLLRGLGFDVISATKQTGGKEELWRVTVRPTVRSLADYLHPIAAFGTQIKSPLQVVFLYGNHTPQELVDKVTSMNLGSISVVFIDRPIDIASRRHIGEIFHTQKSGQNPFLLVDQVLLLYLAMHQETERLPALLKCTLPYASYQPFVRDGGSTADEMFCGRETELNSIINPNGACVVYGGRQLGKTALLERAESRCSKPENKAYAVYSTIIRHKTEADVVRTLLYDIKRKTDRKIALRPCETIREMCSQLSELFRNGKIVSLYLLIDEVDDFLSAIAEDAYTPLQPLVDLRRETKNNFKFVIAGLHNICRAKNATRDNGIFGQLGTPLCIKPLSPTDALKLLSRPLRYLGFQIDRYPHLETILTNTNYYPGILQFFGYILVETLTGQYAKYYRAADGNPPFTLQDEQLGAVMNSSDLNKSIKDKFRWSLELDPRYFMIARCITMLYHYYEEDRTSGSWRGFPVDEIIALAKEYEIHCLENVSRNEYIVLMDEMVEMGILSKPDASADNYRLRRNSFVDIIGESLDNLEAEIINSNVGA